MMQSYVAPYAGAWIETGYFEATGMTDIVAPYAGAWIETTYNENRLTERGSLPTRERGLKLLN